MKRPIWIAIVLLLLPNAVMAQDEELIIDPENTSTGAPITEPEAAPSSSDEEVFVDPENAGADGASDELVVDPLNDSQSASTPSNAVFSDASFIGTYRSKTWLDTHFDGANEDIFEQFTDLDLRLEYDLSGALRVVIEGEFRHWWALKENGEQARASYDARLGEAYVLWRIDRWSFTLGNQYVTWGATDLARPGDVVNAQDLTTISPTGNLTKVPELMLDVSYSGDRWGAQFLLVPFFTANRVWAFGRDTAILNADTNPLVADRYPVVPLISSIVDSSIQDDIQPLVQATVVPDEVPKNVSLGGRLTATWLNADFGLGYFFGWDRTSSIAIDDDLLELLQVAEADGQFLEDFDFLGFVTRNPGVLDLTNAIAGKAADGQQLFRSEYKRLHTLEVDFARYFGPIGVRADAAFQPARTYLDADLSSVRRPTFSTALGLSYEDFVDENDALAVTVEGFVTKPFSATSALTKTFVPSDQRGELDEMFIFGEVAYGAQAGVTLAIPGPEIQITLGSVAYLSNSDLIIGGGVSRRWFTWLRTGVAALFFESYGQDERLTIGTLYDRNDYAGIEIDGLF